MIFHKIQKQHQKETLSTRKKRKNSRSLKSNRSLMSHKLEGNNIGNLFFFLISGNRLFRKHRKNHILEELLEL